MIRTIPEKKTLIIEKVGEGCTWEQAATAAGITRMTIWRWGQADPEFARALAEAKAGPDEEVEAVTYQNATDPDPANNVLRMFWLKSRKPAVYKERLDVTSDGKSLARGFERVRNGRDGTPVPPAETS